MTRSSSRRTWATPRRSQERISDDECILIKGTKAHSSASIILRGPNDFQLDEMERSVHDSLCAVKRTLESGSIVPGWRCASRPALHIYLEEFAGTVGSREQLAIGEFAQSLLVIPKTLAGQRAPRTPPTSSLSCGRGTRCRSASRRARRTRTRRRWRARRRTRTTAWT